MLPLHPVGLAVTTAAAALKTEAVVGATAAPGLNLCVPGKSRMSCQPGQAGAIGADAPIKVNAAFAAISGAAAPLKRALGKTAPPQLNAPRPRLPHEPERTGAAASSARLEQPLGPFAPP